MFGTSNFEISDFGADYTFFSVTTVFSVVDYTFFMVLKYEK